MVRWNAKKTRTKVKKIFQNQFSKLDHQFIQVELPVLYALKVV